MEIKTRFEPGDEVWVMMENKPVNLIIDATHIHINIVNDKVITSCIHSCSNGNYSGFYRDSDAELCESKEKLKKLIFGF